MSFAHDEHLTVRISAENLATCPKTSTYAYTLETRAMFNRDLLAFIYAKDGKRELPATIIADSTAFIYNEIYRVVINAKDFAGNEMEPFEFEFKIEEGS